MVVPVLFDNLGMALGLGVERKWLGAGNPPSAGIQLT